MWLGDYLQTEYDMVRCCYKLLESALFKTHQEYVRTQMIYALLQVRPLFLLLIIIILAPANIYFP